MPPINASTLGDLLDGPPDPDDGFVLDVEETGPSGTATNHSTRACISCDEDIYVGRETYLLCRVKMTGGVGPTFKRLKFCSRDCWMDWASQ